MSEDLGSVEPNILDQKLAFLDEALQARRQVKIKRIPLLGVRIPFLNPGEKLADRVVRDAVNAVRLEISTAGPDDPVHVLDKQGKNPAFVALEEYRARKKEN